MCVLPCFLILPSCTPLRLVLALCYVISLTLATAGGYYLLRKDTIREAEEKTAIFAAAMSSAGQYLTGEIRPKVEKLLPHTYFPEATVGIMMMTQTARFVRLDAFRSKYDGEYVGINGVSANSCRRPRI